MKNPAVVIGNGWSALVSVASFALQKQKVIWLKGSESHYHAPLSLLNADDPVQLKFLQQLLSGFEINFGEVSEGSFVREFHQKAFREPLWTRAQENWQDTLEEFSLFQEGYFVFPRDARFSMDLFSVEFQLREKLSQSEYVEVKEAQKVTKVLSQQEVPCLVLSSGEQIEFSRFVFADLSSELKLIEGLAQEITSALLAKDAQERKSGLMQVVFSHKEKIEYPIEESFYSVCQKESQENEGKRFWGYFTSDQAQSIWTLFLDLEDFDDPNVIAKRLRRLKQALNKTFQGSQWLSVDQKPFVDTVANESILIEKDLISYGVKKTVFPLLKTNQEVEYLFLSDAFGVSASLSHCAKMFFQEGKEPEKTHESSLTL